MLFAWRWTLIFIAFYGTSYAQEPGCTDPQAINYDSTADQNDGSCRYPLTIYDPDFVSDLSDTIMETSGLILIDDVLWTHNDSGGESSLYAIDTLNGKLVARVSISNASNRDWEDITRDSSHIFIGDFGNNRGDRRDLKFYRIPINEVNLINSSADTLSFEYPDQTDFSTRPQNHNQDMEAVISMGDKLYLFSKNWADEKTRLYSLSKEPGHQIADLLDSMDVEGLITGAAFSPEYDLVVLTGYTRVFTTFIWMFWDFTNNDIFSGNKRRIELGIPFHQLEAICWNPFGKYFFISNEKQSNVITVPARLHRIFVDQWLVNPMTSSSNSEMDEVKSLEIHPNPAQDSIIISLPEDIRKEASITIFNVGGKVVFEERLLFETEFNKINIQPLHPGVYFVHLNIGTTRYVGRFLKR